MLHTTSCPRVDTRINSASRPSTYRVCTFDQSNKERDDWWAARRSTGADVHEVIVRWDARYSVNRTVRYHHSAVEQMSTARARLFSTMYHMWTLVVVLLMKFDRHRRNIRLRIARMSPYRNINDAAFVSDKNSPDCIRSSIDSGWLHDGGNVVSIKASCTIPTPGRS